MRSAKSVFNSGIKKIAIAFVSGSLLLISLGAVAPAHATDPSETIDFESSSTIIGSADTTTYAIANSGALTGFGHVEWAPWGDSKDAPGVDWSAAGQPWTHNFIIRDDGSGSNRALLIQKPESAAPWAGVTFLSRTDGKSIVSAGHMSVTARVKAPGDSSVSVRMNLFNTAQSNTITAVGTTSGTADTWSTVTFDFTSPDTGSFDSAVAYTGMAIVFDTDNSVAQTGHDSWGGGWGSTAALHSKLYLVDDVTYTPVTMAGGGGGLPSIRLVPQPITSGGSANANDYTADISQYYSAGSKSYQQYLEGGTTTTLTYQVTTDGTTPAGSGQVVKLYANSPYSGSNATWTVNSTAVAAHSAFDGGYGAAVTATTNSQGRVTFTVVSTDTTGFESAPTSATQARPNSGRLYGTFKPVLVNGGTEVGDMAEDTDLISFDLYSNGGGGGGGGGSSATHANPDHAVLVTASWSSTGLNGDGPIDDSVRGRTWFINQYYNSAGRWMYAYADAGSTIHLTWHVTDDSGAALANTSVSLRTNFAAGTPNATWTGSGLSNGAMSGTTDSSGNVTFTLTNTNTATGDGPSDTTSNEVALTNEQSTRFAWSRMVLIVGSNVITADPNTTVTQSTDLVDLIIVPAGSIAAAQDNVAAIQERARLAEIEREKTKVKLALGASAVMTSDTVAKVLTCTAPSVINDATYAAYYLFINHKLIAGKRFGSFTTTPMYPAVDAVTGDATLTSATWGIAPSWNAGKVSTATCAVQIGNASGSTTSMARAVTIARVGKYVKGSNKTVAPAAVTMRLVSPTMTRDAGGKAVDFVDQSNSPVQDHWSQYYGNANGGLGVFYKYFTAGSTMTLKYHVTDSASGAALPYFNVWLVVNKNYGGVESATFTYEKNGIKYNVAAHSTDLGETQIPGITDVNGDVTFTLVNTNTATSAEPKPEALNKIQPLSVTPVFSTITLMAHLVSESETKETKDFIWAHIVKP